MSNDVGALGISSTVHALSAEEGDAALAPWLGSWAWLGVPLSAFLWVPAALAWRRGVVQAERRA